MTASDWVFQFVVLFIIIYRPKQFLTKVLGGAGMLRKNVSAKNLQKVVAFRKFPPRFPILIRAGISAALIKI